MYVVIKINKYKSNIKWSHLVALHEWARQEHENPCITEIIATWGKLYGEKVSQ